MEIQIKNNIQMIKNELNNIPILLNTFENERTKTMIYPYYDGGLIQLILYYIRKYNLPIQLPDVINSINPNNTNTLLNICLKSYDRFNIKPDLISTMYDNLFSEEYLKNYFFYNKPYDFNIVMEEFRANTSESIVLPSMLEPILIALIALNQNPAIGNIDKNKLNGYMVYVNKIAIGIIKEFDKKNMFIDYYKIVWLYQFLNPTLIKNNQELYYNIVYNLLTRYSSLNNNLIVIDSESTSNNYFYNWICFGIIKDYFSNQENEIYFQQQFLKESSNQQMNQLTTKPKTKKIIEGFENEKNNEKENKKNKKVSRKEPRKEPRKEDKDKDKKDKDVSLFKFILYCIILAILLFLGTLCIIYFWSFMIKKFLQSK